MKKNGSLPFIYFAASVIAMAAIYFLLPGAKLLAFPWNLLGVVPLVVGVVIKLLAEKALKRHYTTVKAFDGPSALVMDGVYRLTRNPIYLGLVLILLGIGLLMGSLAPFVVILIFAMVMHVKFVKVEERMLVERFASRWLDYRNEVRRWI